jgi:hypothetical protein
VICQILLPIQQDLRGLVTTCDFVQTVPSGWNDDKHNERGGVGAKFRIRAPHFCARALQTRVRLGQTCTGSTHFNGKKRFRQACLEEKFPLSERHTGLRKFVRAAHLEKVSGLLGATRYYIG